MWNNRAFQCAYALATTGYRDASGNTVYPTITVVGHSFGGAAAHDLVKRLNQAGVSADFVVTNDARQRNMIHNFHNQTTKNGPWLNFYQKNDFLPGYPVHGAYNYNLGLQGATHITIPLHRSGQNMFHKLWAQMPSCKSSPGKPVKDAYVARCP